MKENTILSIIIPYYNSDAWIGKMLDSLMDQDIPNDNYEIIVIDDGSTDMSPNIIRHFQSMDNRIKAFSQAHLGVSAARNLGLNKYGLNKYKIDDLKSKLIDSNTKGFAFDYMFLPIQLERKHKIQHCMQTGKQTNTQ